MSAALPPPLDPVLALERILEGRFQLRQRTALLRALEGESVREAARSAGLLDHSTTWRHLRRLGLLGLHRERLTRRHELRRAWMAPRADR